MAALNLSNKSCGATGVPPDVLLDGVLEQGLVIADATANYAIPLDGRPRTITLTANVTFTTTDVPTDPTTGSTVVHMIHSGGAWTMGFPAGWKWADKVLPSFGTADADENVIIVWASPDGSIHASGYPVGTV